MQFVSSEDLTATSFAIPVASCHLAAADGRLFYHDHPLVAAGLFSAIAIHGPCLKNLTSLPCSGADPVVCHVLKSIPADAARYWPEATLGLGRLDRPKNEFGLAPRLVLNVLSTG